jgi:hypothetical protein
VIAQPADPTSVQALAYTMANSGVYEELQALTQMSVLKVNEAGIPVLTEDWYASVDLLILDDMDMYWSLKADPDGKYGINEKIRKTLHREWLKFSDGWTLRDSQDDIIFDFREFDEWRDAFEDKQQVQADSTEGVGRFGI